MGFLNASVNVGFTFSLTFCKSNKINHFFCDEPLILALSCSNIYFSIIVLAGFVGFNLTFTILASRETCKQVRKQQLELDLEQQPGSK